MRMNTFGVLYSIETKRGRAEFDQITDLSVETVKDHCSYQVFRGVVGADKSFYAIKMDSIRQSKFDITVHLDGDTLILDPSILNYEHFDKLLGDKLYGIVPYNEHDFGANRAKIFSEGKKDFPLLPRFANSGVIVLRKEGIKKFCDEWERVYREFCIRNDRIMFDEPSFNYLMQMVLDEETIWLPKKYNIRHLTEESKIFHAFGYKHDKKLKEMTKILNKIKKGEKLI